MWLNKKEFQKTLDLFGRPTAAAARSECDTVHADCAAATARAARQAHYLTEIRSYKKILGERLQEMKNWQKLLGDPTADHLR